ncbi:hypothetical protein [Variovorax sp. 160MFSha2.1]|uniref:hypothetical protein n=1 Tax=Variovorax sp. 160MFSha2.1 TaxID=3158367 RepID=UPI003AADD871
MDTDTQTGRMAGELRTIEALCAALIASHPKPKALRTAFKASSGQLLALASTYAGGPASVLPSMEALANAFMEAIGHAVERRPGHSCSARPSSENLRAPPSVDDAGMLSGCGD